MLLRQWTLACTFFFSSAVEESGGPSVGARPAAFRMFGASAGAATDYWGSLGRGDARMKEKKIYI